MNKNLIFSILLAAVCISLVGGVGSAAPTATNVTGWFNVTANNYAIKISTTGNFAYYFYDMNNSRIFYRNHGSLFHPKLSNESLGTTWGTFSFVNTSTTNAIILTVQNTLPASKIYESHNTTFIFYDTYVEMYSDTYINQPNTIITHWRLLSGDITPSNYYGSGTIVYANSISIVNITGTTDTFKVFDNRSLEINGTYRIESNRLVQHSPTPQVFIFNNYSTQTIFGIMGNYECEGMYWNLLNTSSTLARCLDASYNQTITGTIIESPHYIFTSLNTTNQFDAIKLYYNSVNSSNMTPSNTYTKYAWWNEPVYDTWQDQVVKGGVNKVHDINHNNIINWSETITNNSIPIKTIIFDAQWFTYYGDWIANTTKFPDMKSTIETLHNNGFKVILWLANWDVDTTSSIYSSNPEYMLIDNTGATQHYFDFGKNTTRNYWNTTLFRMLSNCSTCYNADGLKLDFNFNMKVSNNINYSNRSFGTGQEFMHNTLKFIYDTSKAAKSDALIIGANADTTFLDTEDVVRTYDVVNPEYSPHIERAKLISTIKPTTPIFFDEHVDRRNQTKFLISASMGVPMVYSLYALGLNTSDYKQMKEILDAYRLIKDIKPIANYTQYDERSIYNASKTYLNISNSDQAAVFYGNNQTRLVVTTQTTGYSFNISVNNLQRNDIYEIVTHKIIDRNTTNTTIAGSVGVYGVNSYFIGNISSFNLTSSSLAKLYDTSGNLIDDQVPAQITSTTSTSIKINSSQNYTGTNWQISVIGDLTGKTWKYKAHNDNTWLTVPSSNISYNGSYTFFNLQNINVSEASNSNELAADICTLTRGTDYTINNANGVITYLADVSKIYPDWNVSYQYSTSGASVNQFDAQIVRYYPILMMLGLLAIFGYGIYKYTQK